MYRPDRGGTLLSELFGEFRYPTAPLTQDTDTPELALRSDGFASAIGRRARPGSCTTSTVSSVWLVWETQRPDLNTYTFRRVNELHLGEPR